MNIIRGPNAMNIMAGEIINYETGTKYFTNGNLNSTRDIFPVIESENTKIYMRYNVGIIYTSVSQKELFTLVDDLYIKHGIKKNKYVTIQYPNSFMTLLKNKNKKDSYNYRNVEEFDGVLDHNETAKFSWYIENWTEIDILMTDANNYVVNIFHDSLNILAPESGFYTDKIIYDDFNIYHNLLPTKVRYSNNYGLVIDRDIDAKIELKPIPNKIYSVEYELIKNKISGDPNICNYCKLILYDEIYVVKNGAKFISSCKLCVHIYSSQLIEIDSIVIRTTHPNKLIDVIPPDDSFAMLKATEIIKKGKTLILMDTLCLVQKYNMNHVAEIIHKKRNIYDKIMSLPRLKAFDN
jgi:hypothetical protein